MRPSTKPAGNAGVLPARSLALLLALAGAAACSCSGPTAPAAGTGLKELSWSFRPAPGQGIPPALALLRYDGTATVDTGAGALPTTIGPISMAEIQAALDECRPLAGTEQGDPACDPCSHATVEVIPARGPAWKLTQHGADAGPAQVKRLFGAILGAVRPR